MGQGSLCQQKRPHSLMNEGNPRVCYGSAVIRPLWPLSPVDLACRRPRRLGQDRCPARTGLVSTIRPARCDAVMKVSTMRSEMRGSERLWASRTANGRSQRSVVTNGASSRRHSTTSVLCSFFLFQSTDFAEEGEDGGGAAEEEKKAQPLSLPQGRFPPFEREPPFSPTAKFPREDLASFFDHRQAQGRLRRNGIQYGTEVRGAAKLQGDGGETRFHRPLW